MRWIDLKRVLIVLLLFCLVVGSSLYYKEKKENFQLNEFIENLDNQQTNLNLEMLGMYEREALEKLDAIKNRYELKKMYSLLGYLNFFQQEYEESNNYFIKALSIGNYRSEEVEVAILMGISKNYLYLNNHEKSVEYFESAESLALEHENNELLSVIYQMRAKDCIRLLTNIEEAAHLLQRSLELNSDVYQNIISCLVLKDLYLGSFQIDVSNEYAIKAITLAKNHEYENLVSKGIVGLIINEFVNESYDNVIVMYEHLLFERQEKIPLYALGPYIYSNAKLYGGNKALDLIEDEAVNKALEDNVYKDYYKSIIRAKVYIEKGEKDKALEQLSSIEIEEQNTYELHLLDVFKQKIYGEAVFEGQALIDYYVELYETSMKNNPNSALRILFLKDIIQKNVELKNYEQAFYFSNLLSMPLESERLIQFSLLDANLKTFVNDNVKYENHEYNKGILIFSGISLAGLLFIAHYNMRENLIGKLKRQLKYDNDMPLLTFQQLYDTCSESYENGSVFVIDLDNFKKFNETYGYVAGDKVIDQIFMLIKREFKEGLVTRYNGQQFIVVTRDDKVRATERAQQLIDKTYDLNIEHVTNLKDLRMTLSVGIVCGNLESSIKLDQYIKKAQDLVLISKEKGKNRLTI